MFGSSQNRFATSQSLPFGFATQTPQQGVPQQQQQQQQQQGTPQQQRFGGAFGGNASQSNFARAGTPVGQNTFPRAGTPGVGGGQVGNFGYGFGASGTPSGTNSSPYGRTTTASSSMASGTNVSPYGRTAASSSSMAPLFGSSPAEQPQTVYLPGYLSNTEQRRSTYSPPTKDDGGGLWSASASRSSLDLSSPSRFDQSGSGLFGRDHPHRSSSSDLSFQRASFSDLGGGLFGRTKGRQAGGHVPMEDEDAPPVVSLEDMEQMPGPANGTPGNAVAAPDKTANGSDERPLPPRTEGSSDPENLRRVIFFGFPVDTAAVILSHFFDPPDIVRQELGPADGNWVEVTFKQSWVAARMVRRNGESIGGVLMVGIKWADEDAAAQAGLFPYLAPSSQTTSASVMNGDVGVHSAPSPIIGTGTGAGGSVGTPGRASTPANVRRIAVMNAPALRSAAGRGERPKSIGPGSFLSRPTGPPASLFKEPQTPQSGSNKAGRFQEGGGYMSKISDMVFGW